MQFFLAGEVLASGFAVMTASLGEVEERYYIASERLANEVIFARIEITRDWS